ncbi:MAG: sigma-70 family RNA polymerase sigma factor, partial [Myxococcales bacterium]|nr:sigma-70 family RNA polymerase sigma factor [Myxococcales bacterium]
GTAEVDPRLSRVIDPGHGAFSVMAKSEDARLLVAALQSLSIEEQAYLMWSYADKSTQPEIAERVGMTAAQVNGRIHRAREKLRRRLDELSVSSEQRGSIHKGFDTWMQSLRRKVSKDED